MPALRCERSLLCRLLFINSAVGFCLANNTHPLDITELVGVDTKTIAARLMWQARLSREKNRRYLKAFIETNRPIRAVYSTDAQ